MNLIFRSILDAGKATITPTIASSSPQLVALSGVTHGDTTVQVQLSDVSCDVLNVAIKRRINKTIAIHAIAEENDDIQVIPIGQGQPHQICVTVSTNSILYSMPDGDDIAIGNSITTGSNGICETVAIGNDVQVIAFGCGSPHAIGVAPGANNFRDTPDALGDDEINGDTINTGANGICNTTAHATHIVPKDVPTSLELEQYLNHVTWGKQANIHFSVIRQDHLFNFDFDRNAQLNDPYQYLSGIYKVPEDWNEIDQISVRAKTVGVDYNVYFVERFEFPVALAESIRKECWVGDLKSGAVEYIVAHEVGHLLGVPGSHVGRNTHFDLMGPFDSKDSPCRIPKIDWNDVNP